MAALSRTVLLISAAALGGAEASAQSALDTLLDQIRPALNAPGWIGNHAPKGVLHDYGVAVWEMPATWNQGGVPVPVTGGGYNHAARRLAADPSFYVGLQAAPPHPLITPAQDFAALSGLLFGQSYSALDLAEIPTVYSAGSSIALQNLVFAPFKAASGAFVFHAYPEVDDILAAAGAAGLAVYGNAGFQNNWLFTDNDYELGVRHGQKGKAANALWNLATVFDPAAVQAAGIDPATHLNVMPLGPLAGLPSTVYLKPMLDVTDPFVIQLCRAHLQQVAQQWWNDMAFYVGGEYFLSWPPPAFGSTQPPVTDYSPNAMTAFQQYMAHFVGGVAAINQRWGLQAGNPYQLTMLTDIGPQHVDPAVSAQAVMDFHAMNLFRTDELLLLQYGTMKAAAPRGAYGSFTFGPRSIELAGLTSDFPASGEWYNTEAGLFAPHGNVLATSVDAARLAGTPLGFGITSPPTSAAGGCPTDPGYVAPPLFQPRCFSTPLCELTQRDVLCAGSVQHGYVKAPGWGTFGSTASKQVLLGHIQTVDAVRDDKLRFMTPWHRVSVHVDEEAFRAFPGADTPARRLDERFTRTHVPHALFSDRRLLGRLFAREQLGRGFLLSAFHGGLDAALMQEYEQVALQTGPQPLVVVLTDWATYQGISTQPLVPIAPNAGLLHWNPATLMFVLVFPDAQPQTSQAALDLVLPIALGILPEPAQPVTVSEHVAPDGEVQSSCVSDGVNWYLAVSNRSPTVTFPNVTLGVHPQQLQKTAAFATGYAFEGGAAFALAPKQTRFVYAGAVIPGLSLVSAQDVSAKVAAFAAALNLLESQGFEVGHGRTQLDAVSRVDPGTYKERAVVGLARFQNLLFLRATRTGAQVMVRCVRWNGAPVAGAGVQLLHLLNGRESQDAPPTNAFGRSVFTIGAVTEPRWDFFASVFQPPVLVPATEPVEVHVHDPATGDQTSILLP